MVTDSLTLRFSKTFTYNEDNEDKVDNIDEVQRIKAVDSVDNFDNWSTLNSIQLRYQWKLFLEFPKNVKIHAFVSNFTKSKIATKQDGVALMIQLRGHLESLT